MSIEVSIIVPIFNEEDDLWRMAEGLSPHFDRIVGQKRWQYVLVDNGSSDGSGRIIERIIATWPSSAKLFVANPNYGEALAQGLAKAQGEWAFIINVDFWDPVFLEWCYRHRGLYDLIMGSKRADASLNQQTNYRRMLSWGLNTVLQSVFGFVGSDTHGQKFLHLPTMRPVLESCVMRRGQFDTEFTLRAMRSGLWLAELPVPIVELRPQRNLMIGKIFRNFVDIFRLHRIMRSVPISRSLRYHRWAREDIELGNSLQANVLLDAARRHR